MPPKVKEAPEDKDVEDAPTAPEVAAPVAPVRAEPSNPITVVAWVKVGEVRVGEPTDVEDTPEWRALIENGLATLA